MMSSGQYPVINGGISASGYIDKYNEDQDTITISQGGASAGYVSWQESPFWAGAHCYVIKPLSNETSNRFIYFFLKNSESSLQQMQHGAGIPALNRDKVRNLWFPVLPLEVQEEIVRILDRFDVYAAELQAELQARKEQYEYYRNLLLTFNPAGCAGEADDEQEGSVTTRGGHSYPIQWKTMGEVCIFKRGDVLSSKDAVEGDVPVMAGGQKPSCYHNVPNRKGETIVVAGSGAYAGFVTYWNIPVFVSDAFSVHPIDGLLPKYVFHYLKNNQAKIHATKKGAGVPHVHGKDIAKFLIPIPPLELQEKIVAILDRFETLVNDLSEGLPAEIAAVKEQYEYYRNRLLTFKEKTA